MFDKGALAARITQLRTRRDELNAEIAALNTEDGAEAGSDVDKEVEFRERQIEYLSEIIATLENEKP